MSWLRRRPVPLLVLGSSALGGAAYRLLAPSRSDSSERLTPHTFTRYTLVDKQPVSSTSAIFTLRNGRHASDPQSVQDAWKRGVWSLQIKQPQLQIARAYTPLPPRAPAAGDSGSEEEGQDVRLLIRHETGGEVSTYLHCLPAEATLELRGPHTEFELPAQVQDVVFLAGGTGIAPAMQMARALGSVPGSRMHILWANRRREECVGGVSDDTPSPKTNWFHGGGGGSSSSSSSSAGAAKGAIVSELDALKTQNEAHDSVLRVQYFVDEEGSFVRPRDVLRRIGGAPAAAATRDAPGARLIVVAGPEGFVEYWAGRKVWAGGREVQGPLGGQLGGMALGEWRVVKL